MAGVEVIGVMAAAGQLVEQCSKIAFLWTDLRSKMKAGRHSAHQLAVYCEELIQLFTKIQHDISEEDEDSIVRGCVEDATQLRDIFKRLSVSAGDHNLRRITKSVEWKVREKEILKISTSLQDKKSTLSLSMIRILPGMASQISTLNDQFSKLSSTLEKRLPEPVHDVGGTPIVLPRPEVLNRNRSFSTKLYHITDCGQDATRRSYF